MSPRSVAPLLQLRSVSKHFRAGTARCSAVVRALDRVHLEVTAGEIVHLCGEGGAGKSTLLLCAAGLLIPDTGEICWGGTAGGWRRHDGICFLPSGAYADPELLASRSRVAGETWLALIDAPPSEASWAHRYIASVVAGRAAAAGAAVIVASRSADPDWLHANRVVELADGRIVASAMPTRSPEADRVAEPIAR